LQERRRVVFSNREIALSLTIAREAAMHIAQRRDLGVSRVACRQASLGEEGEKKKRVVKVYSVRTGEHTGTVDTEQGRGVEIAGQASVLPCPLHSSCASRCMVLVKG
jgi:hypothetical protein